MIERDAGEMLAIGTLRFSKARGFLKLAPSPSPGEPKSHDALNSSPFHRYRSFPGLNRTQAHTYLIFHNRLFEPRPRHRLRPRLLAATPHLRSVGRLQLPLPLRIRHFFPEGSVAHAQRRHTRLDRIAFRHVSFVGGWLGVVGGDSVGSPIGGRRGGRVGTVEVVVEEGRCRWEEEGGRWGEELVAKVTEKGEHALEVQMIDFELIVGKLLKRGKRLNTDEALQFAYINEVERCGVTSQ